MLNFNKLDFSNRMKAKSTLEKILEVWDSDHHIIICDPEDILNNFNQDSIDWQDIMNEPTFIKKDYFNENTPVITDSWKYVTKRLQSDLAKVDDDNEAKYLAVVEVDSNKDFLMRGLFKATRREISTTINPLYEEFRPKSTAEKIMRLHGDDSVNFEDFLAERNTKTMTKRYY